MRKTWLFLVAILTLASCNSTKKHPKTIDSLDNYLVFGKFHGHCLGDCTTLYKLEGNQVFADSLMRFADWTDLKFKNVPHAKKHTETAKALLAVFPMELLKAEETIGCPDCADQGGFALEIRKDGKLQHWRIDTNRAQLPAYLKSYVDKIDAAMAQLKQ